MRAGFVIVAGAAMVLPIGACHGEAATGAEALLGLAGQICDHARVCGCPAENDTDASCDDTERAMLAAVVDQAMQAGLVFDPTCYELTARIIDGLACGAAFAPTCEQRCTMFHGGLLEGEPCQPQFDDLRTSCARGLVCADGTCQDPCRVRTPTLDGPCDDAHPCVAQQYCDPDMRRCVSLPGSGEACYQGQCDAGAWCDSAGSGLCRALLPLGAACSGHRQCETIYCPAGACEVPPGLDRPCGTQEICASGLVCDGGTGRCAEADRCMLELGSG